MSGFYANAMAEFMKGGIDLLNDDIQVLLVHDGYSYASSHTYIEDIAPSSNEIDGTNYIRKQLAGRTVTDDAVNTRAEFDADDPEWPGLVDDTPVDAVIVVKQVTDDSDSLLVGYIDENFDIVVSEGPTLIIRWDQQGIFQFPY